MDEKAQIIICAFLDDSENLGEVRSNIDNWFEDKKEKREYGRFNSD